MKGEGRSRVRYHPGLAEWRADDHRHLRRLIDPITRAWEEGETGAGSPFAFYLPYVWGPDEAEALLVRDGRSWLQSCSWHDGVRR